VKFATTIDKITVLINFQYMIADARGHFFSPTVPNRMSAAANTGGGGHKIKEEKIVKTIIIKKVIKQNQL